MRKHFILFCFTSFLCLTVIGQITKNTELNISFNYLNGSFMENEYYKDYYDLYFIHPLKGVNLDLIFETKWENIHFIVGSIFLYEEYVSYGKKEHKIGGGGCYSGIQFIPRLKNFSFSEKHVTLLLKSSINLGYFFFSETLNLTKLNSNPEIHFHESKNSSNLGSIIEIGPKLEFQNISVNCTGKALFTGNRELNITTLGISVGLGYKF